jgi:hypothetical protein
LAHQNPIVVKVEAFCPVGDANMTPLAYYDRVWKIEEWGATGQPNLKGKRPAVAKEKVLCRCSVAKVKDPATEACIRAAEVDLRICICIGLYVM